MIDKNREPILIRPEARTNLRNLLTEYDAEGLGGTGVGYSAFILAAVEIASGDHAAGVALRESAKDWQVVVRERDRLEQMQQQRHGF